MGTCAYETQRQVYDPTGAHEHIHIDGQGPPRTNSHDSSLPLLHGGGICAGLLALRGAIGLTRALEGRSADWAKVGVVAANASVNVKL